MFFIRLEGLPCAATVWNIARVGKSFEKRFFISVVVFEAVKTNELAWLRRRTELWGYARSGANRVVGSEGLLICFLFTGSLSSSVDSVASTVYLLHCPPSFLGRSFLRWAAGLLWTVAQVVHCMTLRT